MVVINDLYPQVIKICRPLIVEDEVLKVLVKKFSDLISKGLSAEHALTSTIKCNLTHVTDFPDGTETGKFIGLDFFGKIFRLVSVGLNGDRSYRSISRLYEFPDAKVTGTVTKAIEYVARCIDNFIEAYDLFEKKIILGVSSTFGMKQENLQHGKILQWNKDFQCADSTHRDLFLELKMALKKFRNTKNVYLISLVSDGTACLMSALYKDPTIKIGLYLGDETNLTYIERFKNMTVYTGDGLRPKTALDVQMKHFGDDGLLNFIKTDFDYQIDAASNNPGLCTMDKLVSCTYLGEIARLCICKVVHSGVILNGYTTPALSMKDGLKTSDLAQMEMEEEKSFRNCKNVMKNLGYKDVSDKDCLQIRFICRCVARRSSNLIAACLTAMIQRIDSKDVRIVGDGYLIKDFPNYQYYLIKKINQLKKAEHRYEFRKCEKDDTGVGAGLVAFIYRDGIMKLEDKHRALPPINFNKFNLKDLPSSYIDCECQSVDRTLFRQQKCSKEVQKHTIKTKEAKKKKEFVPEYGKDRTDIPEPLISSAMDFNF